MVSIKKKILLGQIILNLFLALTIVQSGLADVVFQQSSGSRTLLSKLLEILKYDPPSRGGPGDTADAGSRASENRTLLSELLEVLEYDPPSKGKPEDTADAGSRGSCDLLAIVPVYQYGSIVHQYGLTAEEYPTFWFYLKSQSSFSRSAKLELQDEQQNIVYTTTFELTQSEGIIHFRLPQTAPPLAIGKKYQWVLSYGEMNNEMHASGVIERIALEPEFESQLKQANPRQRLDLFATNHLWYDTLTELNQLRRANPQDTEINSAWTTLLNSLFGKLNCSY